MAGATQGAGNEEFHKANCRNSFFYDLATAAVGRMGFSLGYEVKDRGATTVSLTPGWMRSEAMLETCGVTDVDGSHPDAWRRMPDSQGKAAPPEIAG